MTSKRDCRRQADEHKRQGCTVACTRLVCHRRLGRSVCSCCISSSRRRQRRRRARCRVAKEVRALSPTLDTVYYRVCARWRCQPCFGAKAVCQQPFTGPQGVGPCWCEQSRVFAKSALTRVCSAAEFQLAEQDRCKLTDAELEVRPGHCVAGLLTPHTKALCVAFLRKIGH